LGVHSYAGWASEPVFSTGGCVLHPAGEDPNWTAEREARRGGFSVGNEVPSG
jgi:hypothetical protein